MSRFARPLELDLLDAPAFTWQADEARQGVDGGTLAPGLVGLVGDDDDDASPLSGLLGSRGLGRRRRERKSRSARNNPIARAVRYSRRVTRARGGAYSPPAPVATPAASMAVESAPVAASAGVESTAIVPAPVTYAAPAFDSGGGYAAGPVDPFANATDEDIAEAAALSEGDDVEAMEGLGKGFFSRVGKTLKQGLKLAAPVAASFLPVAGQAAADALLSRVGKSKGGAAQAAPVIMQAAPRPALPPWVIPAAIGGAVLVGVLAFSRRK